MLVNSTLFSLYEMLLEEALEKVALGQGLSKDSMIL
jgi:hypothetical protein